MTAEDVHAIRAGAVAIVAQCDAALARMAQAQAAAQVVPDGCTHARQVGLGVMGAPWRQRCVDCHVVVGTDPALMEITNQNRGA